MPFETVARVTAAVLSHPDIKTVLFTWHGGEPTVLSPDYYRRALYAQAYLSKGTKRIGNALQTNGTTINHEWCQFFSDNQFYVGVSIDGPSSVNDIQRPFISGRGSTAHARRGIELLKEWGLEFGVLMVIDRAALELGPSAMLDFIKTLGIKRVGFNAARPVNEPAFFPTVHSERKPSPRHYTTDGERTAFLLELYKEMQRTGETDIRVREIEAMKRRISGEDAHACTLEGNCIGQHFIVEANGDLAHCDLFLGDPSYTVGNVYESNLETILEAKPILQLRRSENASQKAMSRCPYYGICNGGCPHDRYTSKRYDADYSDGCCGHFDFISGLKAQLATAH